MSFELYNTLIQILEIFGLNVLFSEPGPKNLLELSLKYFNFETGSCHIVQAGCGNATAQSPKC